MYPKRSLNYVMLVLLLLNIFGCGSNTVVEQDNVRKIAEEYVLAEYSGDINKLRKLTVGEARESVERGDLTIFTDHSFQGIQNIKIVEWTESQARLIITVSSKIKKEQIATNYFENLTLTKMDGEWRISLSERDI